MLNHMILLSRRKGYGSLKRLAIDKTGSGEATTRRENRHLTPTECCKGGRRIDSCITIVDLFDLRIVVQYSCYNRYKFRKQQAPECIWRACEQSKTG